MSAAAAASSAVAARAFGPSRPTRSARVSGPRELLSTTSYPASIARRARVLPMWPLPTKPIVVMTRATRSAQAVFPPVFAFGGRRSHRAQCLHEVGEVHPQDPDREVRIHRRHRVGSRVRAGV